MTKLNKSKIISSIYTYEEKEKNKDHTQTVF